MRLLPILGLAIVAGCANGLREDTFPTGSQTAIGSADHKAVYVTDIDAGALQRVDVASGAVQVVDLGGEPARVARAGERIFVTLRDSRSVAVLRDGAAGLELVETISVGAEPVGIVAREDGRSVYVALSTANEVIELNGNSLAVERTFVVDGQPTWLALHPQGHALYVGSAFGSDLHWVDLDNGDVTTLALPQAVRHTESADVNLSRRVTGDLWVSADGTRLAVPALFADNSSPVADPLSGEDGPTPGPGGGEEEPMDTGGGGGGYGSVGVSVSRFNPAVVIIDTAAGSGLPRPDEAKAIFVAGFGTVGGTSGVGVRSYLASVAMPPDGDLIFATMEASSTVVAMSTTPVFPEESCKDCSFDTGGRGGGGSLADSGFTLSASVFIGTEAGPRGVAFTGDNAWTHTFLDRRLTPLDPQRARAAVETQVENGFNSATTYWAPNGLDLGSDLLANDLLAGRRLFFSATDSRMAGSGAGVSCSTCHTQGRNDGLTWTFTNGVRQTPSLSNPVSETLPVTWTDNVPSVADEAMITSQGRMGGVGLSNNEAANIGSFVDSLRPVDHPTRGMDDAAIERGRILFERADTACESCHPAPLYTDNLHHDLYGLTGVNTPTLIGIAATAPYLHDGSQGSVRDVLELSRSGVMGDTSALSSAEMDDLEAFVLSR